MSKSSKNTIEVQGTAIILKGKIAGAAARRLNP